ncbi:uncharacterized protein LAJ45_07738 [Morchella importuna]|uniref:uncharacterized protein n=1 Tax=Morchella importuna TaxID=1174673 RepID=UPI001E8D9142|nr:uncharacterized protein LAJ45_07738 [Morchella importuna]KAH8148285.1 hypothetical protein LAJ45_07738 [Morchella importuna]
MFTLTSLKLVCFKREPPAFKDLSSMAFQRIAIWAATNSAIVTPGTVLLMGLVTIWDSHRGRNHQVTTIEANLGTMIGVVDKKVDVLDTEIKHTQAIALGSAYVSFTGNQGMKNKWARDIEKCVISDYKDCSAVKGFGMGTIGLGLGGMMLKVFYYDAHNPDGEWRFEGRGRWESSRSEECRKSVMEIKVCSCSGLHRNELAPRFFVYHLYKSGIRGF